MRYIIYDKRDLEELTCRLEIRLQLNVQQMSGKHLPLCCQVRQAQVCTWEGTQRGRLEDCNPKPLRGVAYITCSYTKQEAIANHSFLDHTPFVTGNMC